MRSPRAMDWLLVLGTIILALALFQMRGSQPSVGDRKEVTLTVVPRDKRELGCSSDETYEGGLVCGYERASGQDGNRKARDIPLARTLAPYVSTERAVMVLTNVFAHEAVDKEAQQRMRRSPRDRRFSVRCQVTLLAKVEAVEFRFARRDAFRAGGPLWVARADACVPLP